MYFSIYTGITRLLKANRNFNTSIHTASIRRSVVGDRIEFPEPVLNDAVLGNIGTIH